MTRRLLFTLLLTAVLLMSSLVYWKQTNTPEAALEKTTLLLDWFPNTNHTGIYVAQALGYFAEQGLDVEILQPGEGMSVEQVVAIGRADFGISYQEAVTLARAEGVPIVSIAAILQHNTSAFAARPDSGIRSVRDFAGKTYGGWGSPIELATLEAVMTNTGVDYDQLEITTLGQTDFFNSLGRDNDFQWIFYGWDGVEAARREMALNLIWLRDLDPALDYYTPVIITRESLIEEEPERIRHFLQAVSEGYGVAIQEPSRAAELLIGEVPELDAELVEASQTWLSPQYQAEAPRFGEQSLEVWTRYTNWLQERDLLAGEVNPEAAFTNAFLPIVE